MSQENVDAVRAIYDEWGRGEYRSVDWADPEVQISFVDWPPYGTYRGLSGMAAGWREFLSGWEEFRAEAEDFMELDHERVLVLNRFSGRGRTSGLEITEVRSQGATLFQLRRGAVIELLLYADRDRALADHGLAQPPG